jgi:hypothetical protein
VVPGYISIVGSSLIIGSYLGYKDIRKRSSFYLVAQLALADLAAPLNFIPFRIGAPGSLSCKIQGAAVQTTVVAGAAW